MNVQCRRRVEEFMWRPKRRISFWLYPQEKVCIKELREERFGCFKKTSELEIRYSILDIKIHLYVEFFSYLSAYGVYPPYFWRINPRPRADIKPRWNTGIYNPPLHVSFSWLCRLTFLYTIIYDRLYKLALLFKISSKLQFWIGKYLGILSPSRD